MMHLCLVDSRAQSELMDARTHSHKHREAKYYTKTLCGPDAYIGGLLGNCIKKKQDDVI